MFGARIAIGMVLVGLLAVSAMGQQVFVGTDSNDLSDSGNWSPDGTRYKPALPSTTTIRIIL